MHYDMATPTSKPMNFPVTENYQAMTVGVKGEFFGSVHGRAFREMISDLRAEGKKKVVLDLSKTTLMDSTGVGVLLETVDALRSDGGDLRVAGLEERMRNLFLMTRLLGDVFELYDTPEDAVESFAPVVAIA